MGTRETWPWRTPPGIGIQYSTGLCPEYITSNNFKSLYKIYFTWMAPKVARNAVSLY